MSSTPEEIFSLWFEETHGGTGELELESDVDETIEDRYTDPESF